MCGLGNRKQELFLEKLRDGVPVFESTVVLVRRLAEAGVAVGVYSSSRNCEQILKDAGLGDLFTVRVDGVLADALGLADVAAARIDASLRIVRAKPALGHNLSDVIADLGLAEMAAQRQSAEAILASAEHAVRGQFQDLRTTTGQAERPADEALGQNCLKGSPPIRS